MRDPGLIEDLRRLHPPDWTWLAWLAGALVLGLALALVLRRRKPHLPSAPAAADELLRCWEHTLRELERLGTRLLPEESRDYGIAATGLLRRFVEVRFGLHAPRLTTAEFLEQAGVDPALPEGARQGLGRFLEACDWLKFGRARAEASELRAMHQAAEAFVLTAKPEPAQSQPGGGGA